MNELEISRMSVFDIVQSCNEDRKDISRRILLLGMKWRYLRDTKRWKELGHETLDDFIKDQGWSHSTFYNFIGIYTCFGRFLKGDLRLIPEKRLIDLIPLCRDKTDEQVLELLHMAHTAMSVTDFKNNIRNLKGREDCNHEEVETWQKCRVCGMFLKDPQPREDGRLKKHGKAVV